MPAEPQKLNYSHEALIDQIIANPAATDQQLADVFGRSRGWVCTVKNSGLFREMLTVRRAELTDPILAASLEERLEMVALRSFQVLAEKLSKPAEQVPDNLVLAAAALGAKGMSLGGFAVKSPEVPVVPSVDRIERLAARLENLNRPQQHGEIVDVVSREV